jgi:16S rRNA (cytosine967-C5)-methyltransferase
MKLHPLLVQALASALVEIFREGKYADKVLERLFKTNPKWGKRDRAFVAENVYEIVRWQRKLQALLPGQSQEEDAHSFSENHWRRLLAVNLVLKGQRLPDWNEFGELKPELLFKNKKQVEEAGERKIIESVPDWMDEMGAAELGPQWGTEIHALNEMAPIVLRVNSLKINKEEVQKILNQRGWEADITSLAPDALVLGHRGNVFLSPMFKNGFFEVQDAGSQCIAPFLRVAPGMRIIDACAGAGGKTLHLAALMKNKGSIISLDTDPRKLDELRRRTRRNGVHIVQTRLIESKKTIKRLHNTADRLLLDVPCSGLGTLRRNPDAKWKLAPEFIENVKATQAKILREYTTMLRPGGLMTYATCSILPSENEEQVRRFLVENPDYRLLEERRISPARDGFDGFYMALLEKIPR